MSSFPYNKGLPLPLLNQCCLRMWLQTHVRLSLSLRYSADGSRLSGLFSRAHPTFHLTEIGFHPLGIPSRIPTSVHTWSDRQQCVDQQLFQLLDKYHAHWSHHRPYSHRIRFSKRFALGNEKNESHQPTWWCNGKNPCFQNKLLFRPTTHSDRVEPTHPSPRCNGG